MMDFGEALKQLRDGSRVARVGWSGLRWLWLVKSYIVEPVTDPLGGLQPWIGMHTEDNEFVPWWAHPMDVLATDWQVVGVAKSPLSEAANLVSPSGG